MDDPLYEEGIEDYCKPRVTLLSHDETCTGIADVHGRYYDAIDC